MKPTVGELCALEEPEAGSRETLERWCAVGLVQEDDERPGDVVGAVAVLEPRLGVVCVLEDPGSVAEPEQVRERWIGDDQATAPAARVARSRASMR